MQPDASANSAQLNTAYTDLYDETRNSFLVQYPPQLIIALGLSGVVAFAVTGFLGYGEAAPQADPDWVFSLFHEPWLLFLWFLALIAFLQVSIFRHPSLTKQRNQSLAATAISAVLITVLYYFRDDLGPFFDWLGREIQIYVPNFANLIGKGLFLFLLNLAILAIFWFDTIRRWIRYSQGKPIAPQIDIGLRRASQSLGVPPRRPEFSELISGDLIAGTVLTLLLAALFQPSVLNWIYNLFGGSTHGCQAINCSQVDLYQAIAYFPIAFLILALTAVVNGLAAMNVINNQSMPDKVQNSVPGRASTDQGTKGVVQTIIDTLIAAISRQGQNILLNLALAVRAAAWPIMVFVGVAGAAAASKAIETYLHLTSDIHTCYDCFKQPLSLDVHSWLGQLTFQGLTTVAGGIAAVLGIIFGAALLVYQMRVAENSLRFVGLTAFIVLLTFWIFSLALSGFDLLLYKFFGFNRWPFFQPGISTGISFLALVGYGALLSLHNARMRRSGRGFLPPIAPNTLRPQVRAQPQATGAAVTATSAPATPPAPDSQPPTQPMS